MFVLNIKMDYKKILLFCLICGGIIAYIVEFGLNNNIVKTGSNASIDYEITDENFVSTLKMIHENIDENVGKTIKVTGFVYTLPDFNKNFYVCGRYLEDENTTKVAGYLFKYDGDLTLTENEWIEITGKIINGEYNGKVPVIEVEKIEKVTAPANTYVKQ